MVCPACGMNRVPRDGRCPFCGHNINPSPSRSEHGAVSYTNIIPDLSMYTPSRGDHLYKGQYRLLEQVRLPELQRSSGRAWRAFNTTTRDQVLIREASISVLSQQPIMELLTQRLINMEKHPGLPKLVDQFKEQNSFYFVFSYIAGESLAAILSSGQGGVLPEHRVAAYGYALCEIVSFLSQQQPPFIHGSISPETVIIHPNGRDVSLIHLPLSPYDIQASKSKSSTGYFAPEQVQGMVTPSSDLYGVAATLYHAITSSSPSDRIAFFYPPARRLNPTITQGMENILLRQLRMSVAQRYPSAEEMKKNLSVLLASYPKDIEGQKQPLLIADPAQLSLLQRGEESSDTNLLNIGIFVAILVLIIVGVFFAVMHP